MTHDRIIIGAGLYGLYSALFCAKKNEKILVIECEKEPFMRSTYINQARVHMGYHYPRSLSTAIKSKKYFDRFNEDFDFCIHNSFDKIYATSFNFSWSDALQFKKFCKDADIQCEEINPNRYFKDNSCDGAFLTKEYTYDAQILKNYFLSELGKYSNVEILYSAKITEITKSQFSYNITISTGQCFESNFILNATYASINQIHAKARFEPFKIKYELCEIILCIPNEKLKNVGITVMDGPFFSIMPFGKTGLHSLTSVTFTPHLTSYDAVPTFVCQRKNNAICTSNELSNCNYCDAKPESAYAFMNKLLCKYLKEEYGYEYKSSLFSIKPILKSSEIDDSRPTVIKQLSYNPTFISVLSGKINTVYDLDEVLHG